MDTASFAIVVLSCDKFACLWPLFFSRFDKFFPPNNFPVYLLSNHLCPPVSEVHNVDIICVGDDISWSDNLFSCLSRIQEENVILMIDDGPFSAHVDLKLLTYYCDEFLLKDMNYLNLKAAPRPDISVNKKYGELSRSVGYRASLVPSMWRKQVLLQLLETGESAWEFEILGSQRSRRFSNFFAVTSPVFSLDHIIVKGKIDRRAHAKLNRAGELTGIDFPLMSRFEFYSELLAELRSRFISFVLPASILFILRKWKHER